MTKLRSINPLVSANGRGNNDRPPWGSNCAADVAIERRCHQHTIHLYMYCGPIPFHTHTLLIFEHCDLTRLWKRKHHHTPINK